MGDEEKQSRLRARAHDLGTTLDYRDTKKYPRLKDQLAAFSMLVAPTDKLSTRPELTGDEIATMREMMDHRGEPAKDEVAAVNSSEAQIEDEESSR